MIFLLLLLLTVESNAQYSIVPEPKSISCSQQSFLEFTGTPQLIFKSEVDLSKEIKMQVERFFSLDKVSDKPKIGVVVQQVNSEHKDSYELLISDTNIHINYSSSVSLLYALSTLEQLKLKTDSNSIIKLPTGRIYDYPDFEWRGLHLDCARHFFTVEELKRFIDLMAHYKFNTFHWHLTDDQGWRIEIKKYPKLTEVGAVRNKTLDGHYNDEPRLWDKTTYGGFYSQEDIKDIVTYASLKGVEVVPEIELPGHARAALAAYPNLSCTDSVMSVPGLWGVFDDVFCSDKNTIKFLKNVLYEVCELFPGDYIHIGGDEAPTVKWKECKTCQKNRKKHNLKDEHALQGYFIGKIAEHLSKYNKKLIGWDEILDGGLAKNTVVMSWRGMEGGIAAAHQNHKVVMTPTEFCYFDYYQSSNRKEPLAIGGYLPLEKVYQFNPIPVQLPAEKHKYIIGGQANVWTEYISNFQQVEYMTYPRALALIEKLWNIEAPSYQYFLEKLPTQFNWLEKQNVNYSKAIFDVSFDLVSPKLGDLSVQLLAPNREEVGYCFVNNGARSDTIKSNKIDFFSQNELLDFIPMATAIPQPRINHKVELEAFVLNGKGRSSTLEVDLSQNIGLKPISITKPHNKFTNKGYFTLVDGVFGQRPWKGSEWLGYLGDTIEIIYDLQQKRSLYQIKVSCLKANGSWIYLPKTIDWYFSEDAETWSARNSKEVNTEIIDLRTIQTARFVKIRINPMDIIPQGTNGAGHDPWTFIDEIQFSWN
ncbi:MAG: beta-N-acetylhexosaminidase [Lishizhenia sp.]